MSKPFKLVENDEVFTPQFAFGELGDGYEFYYRGGRGRGYLRATLNLLYFPLVILWLELSLKFASGLSLVKGLPYTVLFSLVISLIFMILCSLMKNEKINRVISIVITALLCVWYIAQLIYKSVFGVFFAVRGVSSGGTSVDMIMSAVQGNAVSIMQLCVPLIFSLTVGGKLLVFRKLRMKFRLVVLLAAVLMYTGSIAGVMSTSKSADPRSDCSLYFDELQQNAACERFGLFTMQCLDIGGLMFPSSGVVRSEAASQKTGAENGTSAVSGSRVTEAEPDAPD